VGGDPLSFLPRALAFAGLCLCLVAGSQLAAWAGIGVPGAVMGLLLLLGALFLAHHVPQSLEDVSAFLLRHLNLFFVPAGVGLMAYTGLVARDLWPILAALFLSTLLGLAVTALVFSWALKRREEGE
jgi:putative effector of murein hydrolase LrgA (UPF0299 family)